MSEPRMGDCAACHFENIEVKEYKAPIFSQNQEPSDLCEVCASTFISNAVLYPGQYEPVALFQSLGYCTNMILKASKEGNTK